MTAPAFIQQRDLASEAISDTGTALSGAAGSFSVDIMAGSTLVLGMHFTGTGGSRYFSAVADSVDGPWTPLTLQDNNGTTGRKTQLWYIADHAGGPVTITCTAAVSFTAAIWVIEIGPSIFDVESGIINGTVDASLGYPCSADATVIDTAADVLVVSAITLGAGTGSFSTGPTSGWTEIADSGGNIYAQYIGSSSALSNERGWIKENGTNRDSAAVIASFVAAGGADALLADDLTATPTLDEPDIGQLHVLAADDLATTATLTASALGQLHALSANDVTTVPTLTEPTLGSAGTDALTADDLAAAPTLTQAALGQVHALLAADVSTAPTLSEPVLALGQVVLYAEDLQIVVTLPQPQLGQVHALTAADISAQPSLGLPTLDGAEDAFGMLFADVRITPALRARAQVSAALQANARVTPSLRGRVRLQ